MRLLPGTLLGWACLAAFSTPITLRAADGDLDTSFSGGTRTVLWGSDDATATALEVLADGDLLVAGTVADPPRWGVRKIWESGAIDIGWAAGSPAFDFEGEAMTIPGDVYDLWRDPADVSERTMLLGTVEVSTDDFRPAFARLTSTGALDPAFDGNGLKIATAAPAGWTDLLVLDGQFLPDGSSVFVGSCLHCPTADVRRAFVAKFLASGAPDTGFSGDGWFALSEGLEDNNSANAVTVDAQGRIVVACRVSSFGFSAYFVARLTSSAAFDGSFGGGDGMTDSQVVGSLPLVTDITTDPSSGRIAVAFRLNAAFPLEGAVEVLTAAGLADTTFSGDGHIDLDLEEGSSIDAVAFQSDGKLLAVGEIDANGTQAGGFLLARMTKSGALDATFDGNGVKRVEFDAAANVVDAPLAVTTWGGRLVAAGFAGAGGGDAQAFALLRTANSSIFADGFERGSVTGWAGY